MCVDVWLDVHVHVDAQARCMYVGVGRQVGKQEDILSSPCCGCCRPSMLDDGVTDKEVRVPALEQARPGQIWRSPSCCWPLALKTSPRRHIQPVCESIGIPYRMPTGLQAGGTLRTFSWQLSILYSIIVLSDQST